MCGPRGGRTGVVVSLVAPDGERTLASDRASAGATTLEPAWLECDALHVSGYALLGGAAVRAAKLAHERGASVSVDLSSWTHVERHRDALRETLDSVKPDVVFGNEREWQALGDVEAPSAS